MRERLLQRDEQAPSLNRVVHRVLGVLTREAMLGIDLVSGRSKVFCFHLSHHTSHIGAPCLKSQRDSRE